MKKLKNIIIAITLSLSILNPVAVLAQTTSTAINVAEYTGVQGSITQFLCTPSEGKADGKDIERCINKLYRFGIAFGGIALVFFLVYAGYLYIVGGESGKGKAKGIIQNAFIGIALLLGSYVILYFINPNLTIIKPIQPPIFTAGDFPNCEDIGFKSACVIDSEDTAVTSSGKGGYMDCPDGIIAFDKKAVPVNGGGDTEKVCKAFMEKLKQIHAKHKITVTSTIRNGAAESQCHYSGNPRSGVCADMSSQSGNWKELCSVIKQIGGLGFLNESGASSTECGTYVVTKNRTGNHLHVYLSTGGGGGTSGGGSRPYCRPIHKFLCDHPANDSGRADPHVWTSSFPEVQANLNELKKVCGTDSKKCMGYPIDQVYRSPEYGAHMRSIFEAYVILYEGWSDSKISRYGQYCDGTIQYVKTSDLKGVDKNSEVGKYIKAHFNGSARHFSTTSSPTTCMSNHGLGISLDFKSAPPESSVVGPGKLCHNIPPGTNGIAGGDAPHYILYSKKRSGEKCTF